MTPEPAEKEFEALINAIPDLAWLATADGDVYWFNDRFYQYTGLTFDEIKNETSGILANDIARKEVR